MGVVRCRYVCVCVCAREGIARGPWSWGLAAAGLCGGVSFRLSRALGAFEAGAGGRLHDAGACGGACRAQGEGTTSPGGAGSRLGVLVGAWGETASPQAAPGVDLEKDARSNFLIGF